MAFGQRPGFPFAERFPSRAEAAGATRALLLTLVVCVVACGVTLGDIDLYAEQIDRPFLWDQRRELKIGRY